MIMEFFKLWLEGFAVVLFFMTAIWLWSVSLKNAGIVDPFWGLGFVVVSWWFAWRLWPADLLQAIILGMVSLWGMRLFIYLFIRNYGKEEDYRYQQFRKNYGAHRYWWFSFFQVFMLQGVLLAFISVSILGGIFPQEGGPNNPTIIAVLAAVFWLIGFFFESVGDFQMARFKANPQNKGKVMDKGLWRYTRHPNYFGDAMVWWGFALFSVYNGYYWAIAGAVVMTWLLLKISGVAMLERNLKTRRPGYEQYIQRTPAFFPWFPRKQESQ